MRGGGEDQVRGSGHIFSLGMWGREEGATVDVSNQGRGLSVGEESRGVREGDVLDGGLFSGFEEAVAEVAEVAVVAFPAL